VLTPLIAAVGATLSAPLFPETTKLVADMSASEIWARYVRYVGAGAVAVAGIITVMRTLPSIATAFMAVTRGLTDDRQAHATEPSGRTDRDLPGSFVIGAIVLVVAVAALVPSRRTPAAAPCAAAVVCRRLGFGVLFTGAAYRRYRRRPRNRPPIALITLRESPHLCSRDGRPRFARRSVDCGHDRRGRRPESWRYLAT
jgi:uncharacterized oligopeptide transporter (OPT) family protein